MKLTFLTLIISFSLTTKCISQIDPLTIIDKVAGVLVPSISDGIQKIKSAKNKDKNKQADELKKAVEDQKKKADAEIKKEKLKAIETIGKDVNYLKVINAIQNKISVITNDVGRLSIFKDINFLNKLLEQEAVDTKNLIVMQFQYAKKQVMLRKSELDGLRNEINSIDPSASGRAAKIIANINSALDEIDAKYDSKVAIDPSVKNQDKIKTAIEMIRSIIVDIAKLETEVEGLNAEAAAMVKSYLSGYEKIKSDFEKASQ